MIEKVDRFADHYPGLDGLNEVFVSVWRTGGGLHEIEIWDNKEGFNVLLDGEIIIQQVSGRPNPAPSEYQPN